MYRCSMDKPGRGGVGLSIVQVFRVSGVECWGAVEVVGEGAQEGQEW